MVLAALVLSGLVGGFLAGLLGVGGGVIFVFVLSIYFQSTGIASDELPRFIISNSIFATFFAGLSGSIRNLRAGNFYLKEVLSVALPGAIVSVLIAWSITTYSWYSQQRFTIFFAGLILFFFYRLVRKKIAEDEVELKRPQVFPFIGLLSGLVSGLSGLGGGVVMIPMIKELTNMKIQKAASISLGVIPVFALSMSIYYLLSVPGPASDPYTVGYIDFKAAIPLALGVIVAAPLGVKFAQKLSQSVIKVMFAVVLGIVALKLIYSSFL